MPPPNLLFIFSDQQHWQAVGFEDPTFSTPHLDCFAAESTVFEQAFCTTPQCSPSRGSIFTGFYPSKTGLIGNIGAVGGRPLTQETIAPALQKLGYRTAYFGKWHLGQEKIATAGWDEERGIFRPAESDSKVTEAACDFIQSQSSGQPFALFISYENPYDIYQFVPRPDSPPSAGRPLPESWSRQRFDQVPSPQLRFMTHDQAQAFHHLGESAWQQYQELYRAKVALFDREAGSVLAKMRERGFWETTLVTVTSDHGDMDAHHRLLFKGPFMYEQMVRVPLMMRLPPALGGTGPARIGDFDAVLTDIVPTLLEVAGDRAPFRGDGVSLRPFLGGEQPRPRRDFVVAQYYGKQQWVVPIRMIRTADWKYNRYLNGEEELYDLRRDPHEIRNLAASAEYAEQKTELAALLAGWMQENNDDFLSMTLP